MGLQTDPEATQRPMRDRASGSTEGNGLLEPYEGKPSSTVLRGGGGGDAAPLPDTRDRPGGWERTEDRSVSPNPGSQHELPLPRGIDAPRYESCHCAPRPDWETPPVVPTERP